jgi:VanZ like family
MDDVAERHDREAAAQDADREQDEEDAGDVQGSNSPSAGSTRSRTPGLGARFYRTSPFRRPISLLPERAGPASPDSGRTAIHAKVALMRPLATLVLAFWLIGGLVLTLQAAHPLPGQVVDDNLVPFHTLRIYLDNLGSAFWMRNLFGNLGLLFPLGLLGPIALPALGRWWRVALLALVYSATIELIQLLVPDRSADIDDVIVNVAGAMVGFLVYRLGVRRTSSLGSHRLSP